MDVHGNLIVPWSTGIGAGAIWKFSPSGGLTVMASTTGAPCAVTVDPFNNIYFTQWIYQGVCTSTWCGPIVMVLNNRTQVVSTVFGSPTTSYASTTCTVGAATSTALNFPQQLVTDSTGNVYVVNQGCYNVVMWNKNTLTTAVFAGKTGVSTGSPGDGGPATSAIFNKPYGLAIDKNSVNVYISDYGWNTIRRVNLKTGIISTFAGVSGSTGTTGDYGAATAALLNQPLGLAIDNNGILYISTLVGRVIRAVGSNSQMQDYKALKANPVVSSTPAPTSFRYKNATSRVNILASPLVGTFQSTGSTGDNGPATAAKIQVPLLTTSIRYGRQFWVDNNGYMFVPGKS